MTRRRALALAAVWILPSAFLLSYVRCVYTHWRIEMPAWTWDRWRSLGRLLLWFTWPAWPLTLWTLWRWRARLGKPTISRHLALPLWFSVVAVATTILTASADRSLLLALPALALAAIRAAGHPVAPDLEQILLTWRFLAAGQLGGDAVGIVMGLLLLAALAWLGFKQPDTRAPILTLIFAPLVIAAVISYVKPIWLDRIFVTLIPFICLYVALLLVSLLIGSLPGIALGAHFAARVPERALRGLLASVLLLVGGKLILA